MNTALSRDLSINRKNLLPVIGCVAAFIWLLVKQPEVAAIAVISLNITALLISLKIVIEPLNSWLSQIRLFKKKVEISIYHLLFSVASLAFFVIPNLRSRAVAAPLDSLEAAIVALPFVANGVGAEQIGFVFDFFRVGLILLGVVAGILAWINITQQQSIGPALQLVIAAFVIILALDLLTFFILGAAGGGEGG